MIRRIALLLFVLSSVFYTASASHLMGGEITWKCLANGQYKFKMKVYRDCQGITFGPPVSLDVLGNPNLTSIPMNLLTQTDISPNCNPDPPTNPEITCGNPQGFDGAVEEFVFESNAITMSGVPPATGWKFIWYSCCRNSAIDNLANAGGLGFTLRAIMYPYNAQNSNPCFDSSPDFAESPNTIICNGYQFTYNHNAIDPELDSLVYSFGQPLDSYGGTWPPASCAYSPGYSVNSPLPSTTQNPNNIPASINSQTGEISYLSFTAGNFVMVTKVQAYKCGILVAEIFREIQVALLNCPAMNPGTSPPTLNNNPPLVTKPFIDPNTGLYTRMYDTVYAGELVHFFLNATDFDFNTSMAGLPNGNGGFQILTLEASGQEFGAGFTNPNAGCIIPPCAVLAPAPPISALAGVGVNFDWQTDCSHLGLNNGCVTIANTYNFIIRVRDDFCPAPAINFSTISVTVIAPPKLDSCPVRCVSVLPNGDISLSWTEVIDTLDKFSAYMIYASNSPGGPFNLIDSVKTLGQTTWTHVGANGQNQQWYYQLQTRSLCNIFFYSGFTDVVSNIILNVANNGNGTASLIWNPIRTPLLSSSLLHYKVWLEHPLGTWTLIDSTTNVNYLDTILIDICQDTVNYRVEIQDSIGCTSVSSIDGALFQTFSKPDPPSLRCLVANNNGQVVLTWVAPVDTGLSFDGYFIWKSNNAGGPFTLIDSIKVYAQTTYTNLTANVMANPVYYYLKTFSDCNNSWSVPSDTLQAIRLNVTKVGSNANLNWNALRTPPLPSSTGKYWIYREFPMGVWSLIDSTNLLTYSRPELLCNDTVNYRIELKDDAGCISISTIDGERFVDNSIPDPPDLRCIAVNGNGNITFNWVAPTDTGAQYNSYHLYFSTNAGGPFIQIDSLFNYNTLTYTYNSTNAYNNNVFVYLKTRTGCGVQYSPGGDTLQAIRLTVTNPGTNIANLSWNAIRTPLPVTSTGVYDIYKEFPAGIWTLIGNTTNTNYLDSNFVCKDSINYRVELSDASGCKSISTIAGQWFIDQTIPASPDLRCISVNGNGSVSMNWIAPVDTGLDFNSYHVFISNNAGGPFTEVDSIFNYNQFSFTHATANAYAGPLYYYVETRTGCGVKYSNPSATLQPMIVTVTNPGNNTIANISWNPIITPNLPSSNGVYNIFRRYTAGGWSLIGNTAATTYIDTNNVCIDSSYYRVEIGDASGCNSVSGIDGDNFVDQTVPAAPDLRCTAADVFGNVTLTWIPPVDTALRFNSYHIFYSNNPGGPFILIDSIFNYFTTSYTHNGANANISQLYYYIETRSGCGVKYSPPSETLHVIKLNVTSIGSGIANLAWNEPHTPLLPSMSTDYKIYKEYPKGVWTYLASTPFLTWVDTNNVCSDTIAYRIELSDASGCINVSTVDRDHFFDGIAPAVTGLDTVSVNPANGQTTVSWFKNTSGDVVGYIIYLYNGSSWDSIGAVNSINVLSWIYTSSNANNGIEIYSIAAFDSCGNLSPVGTGHNTIWLRDSLNKCDASIDMWWNPYTNMQGGVASYNVLMSENGSPFSLLANVTETNYRHFGIKKDSIYCYYIQAVGNTNNRTASSNKDCITADVLIFPEFTYLKTATVQAPNEIYIEAFVDTLADIKEFKLQRSLNKTYNFATIQTIPFTSTQTISFTDNTAATNESSYFYRVIAVSTCDKNMDTSNVGRSILLQGVPNDNLTNTIYWNPYEEWDGKVSLYKIYRYVNGSWTNSPIAVVPPTTLTYTDDIQPFYKGDGIFCYLIEAVEANGNVFGFIEKSESNEWCITQEPHIWVPNGFTPGGQNPTFYPQSVFTIPETYRMIIYNRWGQKLFESNNILVGWDGKFQNQDAPEGVYAYTIQMKGTNGKELLRRGTVTLIR